MQNVQSTRSEAVCKTLNFTWSITSHMTLGRLKMREWKKRYGQNCKGGKCRSKPYGTPTRDFIETTLSYFVILVLILVT